MASTGTVRLGFFVHSTAESTNDFTVSGVTDANFAGTMTPVDCVTLTIP
jgi:hypothetical protein